MRNYTRNRKKQEAEAEAQAAYYAPGGFFDTFIGIDGHRPDCDVFGRPPDWIGKSCNCGRDRLIDDAGPKDVFVGLPPEYKSPAAERLKANLSKTQPLCHQNPCNDPTCRLDHVDRA